jgi:phosphoglycerate dehydrogenase-like enzyme
MAGNLYYQTMKNEKHSILILSKDAGSYDKLISKEHFTDLERVIVADDAGGNIEPWDQCNIILGDPDLVVPQLPHMKRLQWVQSTWAGITPLLVDNSRKDYLLTGVKGVFGPLMSEYVLCYMLMHEKKTLARYRAQQRGVWDDSRPGRLRDKLIGIMGVGSIGGHIASTAKYFGMRTRGYTRSGETCTFIDHYFHGDRLSVFASGLDYLVSVLPDISSMDKVIDRSVLGAMKNDALLINAGRGNVIDEKALVGALEKGDIGGAVLDVFREEPLPTSHPFWNSPNLIITSHTAGVSFSEDIFDLFKENFRNFVRRERLNYIIDFEHGY